MNGDSLIGKTLGNRYEILEVIGTGGMATVYKAKCKWLNRYVAIKVLRESFKDDVEIVKKFNTESQAAASLSHHNIVSIYDVGYENGNNYIVMEYIEGITLKEYIKKKGMLDWHEACQFASQIALALDHAHNKKIIHRDIKPHNILMTHDLILKVADFGIARAVSSETVVVGGAALGSVHYISPEQARGGYTDARSDIYSLGVVMYEMLTGQLPFDGDNPVAVALMHLNNEPKNVKQVNPDIPENVATIVMKAISKEQHSRYQTAMDMIVDLKSAMELLSIKDNATDETIRVDLPKQHRNGEISMEHNKKNTKKQKPIKTPEQKKQDKIGVMLGIATIIVIAVIAFGTFFVMSGGAREVQVPNLTNKTLAEAEQIAKSSGFTIDENMGTAISDVVPQGSIISQDPGANQSVKKNTVIKVVVSSGKNGGSIDVPNVLNLDYKEAILKLKEQQLDYKIVQEQNSKLAENIVISQTPMSGAKVSAGEIITLHISTGNSQKIIVPNVVGEALSKAQNNIKAVGLQVGNISKDYSDFPIDTVIYQSPQSQTEATQNSSVNIVISMGQQPVESQKPIATRVPVATPKPTQPPTPKPELKVKTLTLTLPDTGKGTVEVKVVANGKVIHNQTHNTSEGVVNIDVASSKDAQVQAYIDGEQVVDKIIKFE